MTDTVVEFEPAEQPVQGPLSMATDEHAGRPRPFGRAAVDWGGWAAAVADQVGVGVRF